MKADKRRQRIVDLMAIDGHASSAVLAQSLKVSEMTIRRDLSELEASGAIARVHGGAVIPSGSGHEPPFNTRTRMNAADKAAVADEVARLIDDGATVFLDGGSTGVAIAKSLASRDMTVCTPSMRVAEALKSATRTRLMMTGGVVRPGELSMAGPAAIRMIGDHRFDWYVMTVSGLSLEAGCTEWNLDDAMVKTAALSSAKQVLVAADASKIGATAFSRVCGLDRIQWVVTNPGIPDDFAAGLETFGVHLRTPKDD